MPRHAVMSTVAVVNTAVEQPKWYGKTHDQLTQNDWRVLKSTNHELWCDMVTASYQAEHPEQRPAAVRKESAEITPSYAEFVALQNKVLKLQEDLARGNPTARVRMRRKVIDSEPHPLLQPSEHLGLAEIFEGSRPI